MELDEVQNGNDTAHGPYVPPARADVASRVTSLAASKTGCTAMVPSSPIHYHLQTHRRFSTSIIWIFLGVLDRSTSKPALVSHKVGTWTCTIPRDPEATLWKCPHPHQPDCEE